MISLYQYIVEKRGLLRDEWNYKVLIEKLVEFFIQNELNDPLQYKHSYLFNITDVNFGEYLPLWIKNIQIEIPNRKNSDQIEGGRFYLNHKFEDGRLSFKIRINTYRNALATYDKEDGGENEFRAMCISSLNHELKHAFDSWIKCIKSLPEEEGYNDFMEEINSSNGINGYWNNVLKNVVYCLSRTEMSAHQQQYLSFYRENSIGISFINELKNDFNSAKSMLEYFSNHSYQDYHYDLVNDFLKKHPELYTIYTSIDILFHNKYLQIFSLVSNSVNQIQYLSDEDCEKVYQKFIKGYRIALGKTISISDARS